MQASMIDVGWEHYDDGWGIRCVCGHRMRSSDELHLDMSTDTVLEENVVWSCPSCRRTIVFRGPRNQPHDSTEANTVDTIMRTRYAEWPEPLKILYGLLVGLRPSFTPDDVRRMIQWWVESEKPDTSALDQWRSLVRRMVEDMA